ncbi:amidohydrolase [Xiamenia xianingshaonis]|uniref:Amidohydrolase n=1 Tax=Xiamenia xianingshaonis TaxID=2682776 RepID=A0A9E6MP44_9ACTN|nr:amidohydrolase [Xiamenia xianingshaonis]NHM14909.1 amidohydrolase family protein [Xiamenia xianingshaonis]QTU83717.1 amidohydrolase [Xiamenia xianingshaonis]
MVMVDQVFLSQRVFTGLDNEVRPLAMAVAGDRIVEVVELSDLAEKLPVWEAESGGRLSVVDFGDAFVAPGFHDSHVHFFHSAVYSSPLATTFLGENEQDCVNRMVAFAKTRPEGWLLAQGWRQYRWDPPVMPTKASLDAAFPDRPVALYSGDAHTLWLNSVALAELGIDEDSVAPEGGYYSRDEQGELTGIVGEVAAMELMPRIMNAFSDDEIADAYQGFLATLAKNGITSVCDMSLMASPGLDFIRDDIHARLLGEGRLTARIHLFPTLLDDQGRFEAMRRDYCDPRLQAPGFKQFFDGVSSAHTAWLTEPYTSDPSTVGRPSVDPCIMRKRVLAAAEKGYPVRIHAIGDAAIHCALDIFEEARDVYGPLPEGLHNCIEHLENFLPQDVERLAKLDVVAAVQPPHMTLDPGGPERDLGPDRVPYMWPFRMLLDDGATLAFGTDSPVVAPNSLDVLYSAVTRQDPASHAPCGGWLPQQRIMRAEALRAYTHGSAAAAGRADELGLVAPGYLADLVVLDTDLVACADDELQNARVLATVLGGETVYSAAETALQ